MIKAQLYCTLNEVIADMKLAGDDGSILERIAAASVTIERELGLFIPIHDTRKYRTRQHGTIAIDPILTAESVKVGDIEINEYTFLPETSPWIHGPAVMLRLWHGCHDSIEISGEWGKYNELRALIDSISLDATQSELEVDNASLMDVGMVLRVEDEQFSIKGGNGSKNSPAATAATSLLDGEVSDNDEVITVDNGSEFHVGEALAIENEDLMITRISSNDLVVKRGWNDTLIDAHADDTAIAVYRTFAIERGVNGTEAIAHDAAALCQYLVPADVNWLCRQITGLMIMKAKSGFQGRTGNAETGQSMYFSEFPPNQIDEIRKHYSIKVY